MSELTFEQMLEESLKTIHQRLQRGSYHGCQGW